MVDGQAYEEWVEHPNLYASDEIAGDDDVAGGDITRHDFRDRADINADVAMNVVDLVAVGGVVNVDANVIVVAVVV